MRNSRLFFFLPIFSLLVAPLFLASPAQAAPKKVTVSIKTSASSVYLKSSVKISGKVSGKSAGATVKLQRKTSKNWSNVATSKVSKSKTYSFKRSITNSKAYYRVKVYKNKKVKTSTSKSLLIRGKARPVTPAPVNPAPTTREAEVRALILKKTNEFRATNGLAPLKGMTQLDAIAQDWSKQLAETNTFYHRPNFTQNYPAGWTRAGENIAAGQQAENVVQAWIDSPGHRANLLGDYTHLGVGYYEKSDSTYKRYFTQNFGKY